MRRWSRFIGHFLLDAVLFGLFRHLFLLLILATLVGIVAAWLFEGLGVPLLFWHHSSPTQGFAGFTLALTIATVLFQGFLLDTRRSERNWYSFIPQEVLPSRRVRGKQFAEKYNKVEPSRYPTIEVFAYQITGLALITVAMILVVIVRELWPSPPNSFPPIEPPFSRRIALPIGYLIGCVVSVLFLRAIFRLVDHWAQAFAVNPNRRRSLGWSLVAPKEADAENLAAQTESRLRLVFGYTRAAIVIVFAACSTLLTFGHRPLPPAVGFCILCAALAVIYGIFAFAATERVTSWLASLISNASLIVIVLLIATFIGGLPKYKIRLPGLDPYYAKPTDTYAKFDPSQPLDDRNARNLIPTTQPLMGAGRYRSSRQPLVIVCSSGGGIRAASWTVAVLLQLEKQLPDFPYHVRLMTGASGGMLGNAYYATSLGPPGNPAIIHLNSKGAISPDEMINRISADSLSPTIQTLIFRDIPFLPIPKSQYPGFDRGGALETAWQQNLDDPFKSATFTSIRPGEEEGWRPSLVFSPMIADDGRRVLLSNLDLEPLITSGGHWLDDERRPESEQHKRVPTPSKPNSTHFHDMYSRSGWQFAWMFPKSWDNFHIATAARMSASFPYVSPAATLPTVQHMRIVDAGYYDNYGITVATSWLEFCLSQFDRTQIEEHCSGIVIIQIRDSGDQLNGEPNPLQFGPSPNEPGPLLRGLEWFSSPPLAFWNARDSVSLFRNDKSLERLSQLFDDRGYDPDFFTTVRFDYRGGTLTWYLAPAQIQDIKDTAESLAPIPRMHVQTPEARRDDDNQRHMRSLEHWWKTHQIRVTH